MNSYSDQRTGGASIIPSARPSIHDHSYCPFAYSEAMGGYGIDSKKGQKAGSKKLTSNNNKSNQSISPPTVDEVDHISQTPSDSSPSNSNPSNSNLSNTSPLNTSLLNSPLTQTLTPLNQRKTFDGQQQTTENDIRNLPSISLPATCPNCSNELRDDKFRDGIIYGNQYNVSCQSANQSTPLANDSPTIVYRGTQGDTFRNIDRSGSVQRSNGSPILILETKPSQPQESSRIVLPLLLLVAFLATVAGMFNTTITKPIVYDESTFYNDIDNLGNKYRIDSNAVLQLQTGIATIVKRQDTGSFIFVYNSNDYDFNPYEFNQFVNDISNIASKYLRNDSNPTHYTLLESLEVVEGPSELINTYRDDLDKTGVMLVKHVEDIPSALAMAFHFICDEYNPVVKKSAIFFTLNLAKCSETENKPTHTMIEKCLTRKWSSVLADSIGPLLTRVVSVVIDVTSSF